MAIAIMMYVPEIEPSKNEIAAIYVFDFIVVAALIIDFYRRASCSEKGFGKYILGHWYELPAMLPLFLFTAIEDQVLLGVAVRSLRLLRLFRLLRLLRLANLFRSLQDLKNSGFVYFIAIFTAAIIFGSIAIYAVEAGAENTTINSYEDAVWFAITSATISGYGDVYPSTTEGRIIGVILIFVGLGLILGFLTTLGATVFAHKTRPHSNDAKSRIKRSIDNIEQLSAEDVTGLGEMLKELHRKSESPQS